MILVFSLTKPNPNRLIYTPNNNPLNFGISAKSIQLVAGGFVDDMQIRQTKGFPKKKTNKGFSGASNMMSMINLNTRMKDVQMDRLIQYI